MNEKLLEIYRSDFTNSLIHLTRDQTVWKGFDEIDEERKALDVLKLILGEGVIKGGSGFIKGPNKAVCFSEIPLSSIKHYIQPETKESRYRPYGICIRKKSAFRNGARPVIYIPDNECGWIPDDEKWRQVRFEYGEVDFTFEREWRKKGDLDLRNISGFYVICWNPSEVTEFDEIINDDIKTKLLGYLPMKDLIQMF